MSNKMKLNRDLSPEFTNECLKALNARQILTVMDFLSAPVVNLVEATGMTLKAVDELRALLIEKYTVFPTGAYTFYKNYCQIKCMMSTYIPRLDNLLKGGFITGELSEIYGSSSSGKTQFCLNLAANTAFHKQQIVYYIDTKNEFCAKRIFSILNSQGNQVNDIKCALEKIKVIKVNSAHQLLTFLPRLYKELAENKAPNTRLLIMDSVCSLIFSHFMRVNNAVGQLQATGLLHSIGIALRQIAVEFNMAVVIVNLSSQQMSNDDSQEHHVALGKQWLSFPNNRIYVSKDQKQITFKIVKSTRVSSDTTCTACLTNNGFD